MTERTACSECPWTSAAERDRAALTDKLKATAANGMWFCCHVNMGTCYGAQRFAASRAAEKYCQPVKP